MTDESVHSEVRTLLPFERHHAFIIGIDEYAKVSPLQTAVNDARRLAEVLEGQQHFLVHPPLLNARGDELRNLINSVMPEAVGKDDRVLFYFAGHGIAADGDDGPAGYIVPADADPTDVRTLLPMEDVQRQLDTLPCRHMLLILDCCFSGAFKWSSRFRAIGALMPKKIYKERYDRFVLDPAWQVITSSAYDQKALDVLHGKSTGDRGLRHTNDNVAHSPFAAALFEGLAGAADAIVDHEGDGVITVTELYSYIRDQIEPATIEQSQKQRQTPGFFPLPKHDKGEFIFLHPRHRLNLPAIPVRSPFKGAMPFNEEDKELFYGRSRIIDELRQKLAGSRLLGVTGPSGSGKSSVVKAGLIPLLRAEGYEILQILSGGPDCFATVQALADATPASPGTILVIDAVEDVLSGFGNPDERTRFLSQLKRLLDGAQTRPVKLVITVRSDFESAIAHSELDKYWEAGRDILPPFSVEELKEIIVMPTLQEVMIFDPPDMVDEMIEDVVQSPGAVSLLSCALGELYEAYRKSGRQDRALRQEEYQSLGGVIGLFLGRADAFHESLDENGRRMLRKIVLRMVALNNGVRGKRVQFEELQFDRPEENTRVRELVARLVDERLVVKGFDFVEPAHDALVQRWKVVRRWMNAIGQEKIVLNGKLAAAAVEFANSGNAKFLWNENPHLAVLQHELNSPEEWFNALETAFIRKSIERKKRLSRIAKAVTAAVVLALSALTLWAVISRQEAVHNLKTAETNLLAIGAAGVLSSDNTEALQLATTAYGILEDDPPVAATQILSKAFHTLQQQRLFYSANVRHADAVTDISFSPSDSRFLTASRDGTVRLWDAQGNSLKIIQAGYGRVTLASFSPDGSKILTTTQDGVVTIRDSQGTALDTLRHSREVYSALFSPDGNLILTACKDDTARLWTAGGGLVGRGAHANEIFSAVFDTGGTRFLTASADGSSRIWHIEQSGLRPGVAVAHAAPINRGVFSKSGLFFATSSRDGSAAIWSIDGARRFHVRHNSGHEVYTVEFSPDERHILTASSDHTARLWDISGHPVAQLPHTQKVYSASFSSDGSRMITASADSTARIWTREGLLLATLRHHGEVTRAMFSRDGSQALTASKDGTARLWNLSLIDAVDFHKPGQSAIFSPAGNLILTLKYDENVARLWNFNGQLVDSISMITNIEKALFSPGGQWIFLADEEGNVALWSVATQKVRATYEFDGQRISTCAFSPDGKHVLVVVDETEAWLCSVPDGSEAAFQSRKIRIGNHVNAAVFVQKGDGIITASSDGYARFFTGEGIQTDSLDHAGTPVRFVRSSPVAGITATVAHNGLIRLWKNGKAVDSLQAGDVRDVLFPGDGNSILVVEYADTVAHLWDLDKRSVSTLAQSGSGITCAVFLPDSRTLVTGGMDGIARLWKVNGELLAEYNNHGGKEIMSVAASADGRYVLTAAFDNSVRLWWTPRTIYEWVKNGNLHHKP